MRGAPLWLGCVACAQAGTPDVHIDASGPVDGSTKLIDAPRVIDGPPAATCSSAASCAAAIDLGQIDADQNSDSKTATGYQAAWYKIRLNEGSSSAFAKQMKVTFTLSSPTNENYDLFVYLNTDNDVIECTTPNGTATGTAPQTRQISWGESGTFSNNDDDSRTASIEVRPQGTNCSASSTWTLTVRGNQ